MDVSFDPNTENKKIQIKVTNDKKKINENTVNTGKKESEGIYNIIVLVSKL